MRENQGSARSALVLDRAVVASCQAVSCRRCRLYMVRVSLKPAACCMHLKHSTGTAREWQERNRRGIAKVYREACMAHRILVEVLKGVSRVNVTVNNVPSFVMSWVAREGESYSSCCSYIWICGQASCSISWWKQEVQCNTDFAAHNRYGHARGLVSPIRRDSSRQRAGSEVVRVHAVHPYAAAS